MGSADPVESLESGYENQFEGPFPRLKFILLVSYININIEIYQYRVVVDSCS